MMIRGSPVEQLEEESKENIHSICVKIWRRSNTMSPSFLTGNVLLKQITIHFDTTSLFKIRFS